MIRTLDLWFNPFDETGFFLLQVSEKRVTSGRFYPDFVLEEMTLTNFSELINLYFPSEIIRKLINLLKFVILRVKFGNYPLKL